MPLPHSLQSQPSRRGQYVIRSSIFECQRTNCIPRRPAGHPCGQVTASLFPGDGDVGMLISYSIHPASPPTPGSTITGSPNAHPARARLAPQLTGCEPALCCPLYLVRGLVFCFPLFSLYLLPLRWRSPLSCPRSTAASALGFLTARLSNGTVI